MQDEDDDPEVFIKGSSKRKSFQDSLPHSRVTGNTLPDVKGLKQVRLLMEKNFIQSVGLLTLILSSRLAYFD